MPKPIFYLLLTVLLTSAISKDPSTLSNCDQILQTGLEVEFKIDFDTKTVYTLAKLIFKALQDGEEIVLDTKSLKINSIIDSDTGDDLEFHLDTRGELKSLGTPLKIQKSYKKDEQVGIVIKSETTSAGGAVGWNEKEQTYGKEYPFVYTQGEPIKNRALLPIQDTPSVKIMVTISITVKKDLFAVASGIFDSKVDYGDYVSYVYHQNVPIPSYLIAFAAGKIEQKKLSDRVIIYGEKEILDKAVEEFAQIEEFIQYAEIYTTPYEWGMCSLIVLPPSFPYGGMENPTMIFVTPTIIAGDKSLANVVIHEISHSWSGNLVTMSNWNDFWLNEGFTIYLENKVGQLMNGDDHMKLASQIGYNALEEIVTSLGPKHEYTKLRYDVKFDDPEDAMSDVAYYKGYNFLYYTESLIKRYTSKDIFRYILQDWFTKYKYKSVSTEDWQRHLKERLEYYINKKTAEEIYNIIDWDDWLYSPGMPKIKNNFTNIYSQECLEKLNLFFSGELKDDFKDLFVEQWKHAQRIYFLNNISNDPRGLTLTTQQYRMLNEVLNLKTGYNAEINFVFYLIMVKNKISTEIEQMDEFLGKYGRMKYLRPLYRGLAAFDKPKALEIFNKYKNIYNPIAVRLIENDLKKIN